MAAAAAIVQIVQTAVVEAYRSAAVAVKAMFPASTCSPLPIYSW